ncbi:MAG: sigma-70 family RNA polymerase sigma factor [Gammaproteobacteria bacterium]|jgi:RNA polymerase sigma-70 factor (ECF subfamily)
MDEATRPAIESALVRSARCGDCTAREALYRRFAGDTYTLVRRILGSESLAEDVLQETFIDVFMRLEDLRNDEAFGAWLRRIAVNRALSHLRSAWMSRRVEWTHEEFQELPAAAEVQSDTARLEAALDALPDTARAVVWLYDVEGYTHREIAKLMGRSVSFSKSRLARAHAHLRELLGAEQHEHAGFDEQPDEGPKLCVGELKTI